MGGAPGLEGPPDSLVPQMSQIPRRLCVSHRWERIGPSWSGSHPSMTGDSQSLVSAVGQHPLGSELPSLLAAPGRPPGPGPGFYL